ncbi:MAG TPA: nucleotide exchange factor GrpE [Trueperaceae bacterium]
MHDDTHMRDDHAAGAADAPAADREQRGMSDDEAAILRDELNRAKERLKELEAEVSDAKDRYLRARAEFENYRRRMQDELARERELGADSALLPVLNVYDDLERALDAAAAANEDGPFVTGVRAVRDSLLRQLEALGITPVGLRGEGFDPSLHEALAVVPPGPDAAEGTIVQTYSAGFVKGDRLVRPAKVVVAKEHS